MNRRRVQPNHCLGRNAATSRLFDPLHGRRKWDVATPGGEARRR
jgi:hypothetical protein